VGRKEARVARTLTPSTDMAKREIGSDSIKDGAKAKKQNRSIPTGDRRGRGAITEDAGERITGDSSRKFLDLQLTGEVKLQNDPQRWPGGHRVQAKKEKFHSHFLRWGPETGRLRTILETAIYCAKCSPCKEP